MAWASSRRAPAPRLEGGLLGLVLTATRLGRVHVAIPHVVLDEKIGEGEGARSKSAAGHGPTT